MCLYRLPDGKQGEQAVAGGRVLIQYPLGSTQIPHLTVITDAWRIGAGDAFYFSPVTLNKKAIQQDIYTEKWDKLFKRSKPDLD